MPSDATAFWMNRGVEFAVAVGTVGAVIVALFGRSAQSLPPQLLLAFPKPEGEKTQVYLLSGQALENERPEDARYYRLQVSNARRWSPATQVQVALIQIEERSADGSLFTSFTGDVPPSWKHQQ